MKIKTFLGSMLGVVGVFSVVNPASAAWVDMHGTQFVLEYPYNTTSANTTNWVFYKGWGLDFTEKAGTSNWVHASVPAINKPKVSGFYIRYYSSQAAGRITQVDIYDGPSKVKAIPIATTYGAGGERSLWVSTGYANSFNNGFSVSVLMQAAGADTRFIIRNINVLNEIPL